MFAKNDQPYHLYLEYQSVNDLFDQLKSETDKSLESIQRSLQQSRPMIISIDQMDSYLRRLNNAHELILSLDLMLGKTFDTYITLVRSYWLSSRTGDTTDPQRLLAERSDVSMKEWQVMSGKIERFHQERKSFNWPSRLLIKHRRRRTRWNHSYHTLSLFSRLPMQWTSLFHSVQWRRDCRNRAMQRRNHRNAHPTRINHLLWSEFLVRFRGGWTVWEIEVRDQRRRVECWLRIGERSCGLVIDGLTGTRSWSLWIRG